jgi:hypothetical protein
MKHFMYRGIGACLMMFVSSITHADPLAITGGSYVSPSGMFTLTGDEFSLTAGADFPFLPCQPCTAAPNEPLVFSTNLSEAPFSTGFQGEFNGVSYPVTYLNGSLTFTAPTLNSSVLSPDNLVLTFPFTMAGNIVGFTSATDESAYFTNGSTSGAFVNALVGGSGTGTARFALIPASPGLPALFEATGITYQFEPEMTTTPEPASLLLLGTGIAGVFARRRWALSNSRTNRAR